MATGPRRARDLALLDALDAFGREAVELDAWRLVREGPDPTAGGPSQSRWCNGSFDVLYASLEKDGAVAEIEALLALQPVAPSKARWIPHRLKVVAAKVLRLPDLAALDRLGVDTGRYAERDYRRTQGIADAAFFLGYDGLIAPSARWGCPNLVLFADRVPPGNVFVVEEPLEPVDWRAWRERTGR